LKWATAEEQAEAQECLALVRRVAAFVDEYQALCQRHSLMVQGSDVAIGEADITLSGLLDEDGDPRIR